jgi:cytochrome c553
MKRRTITLVIFLLFSSLTFVSPRLASVFAELRPGTEPQRRTQTGRRARRPARPRKPQIDYSKFNHSRAEHQQKSCDSCHSIPALKVRTPDGQVTGAVDIKDYPKHESCLDCHRQRFFKGARPAICSNCHTVVSPRNDKRFTFPKQVAKSQFSLNYPHKNHVKSTMLIQFKTAFGSTANTQATCTFCHKVDATEYKPPKGAPEGTFVPAAGTFMTMPKGHATCFQCHFQKGVQNREQPPLASDCAECHKNNTPALQPVAAATPAAGSAPKPTPTPAPAHAVAQKPSKPAPAPLVAHTVYTPPWAERVVQKFPHEKDDHKKRKDDNGKEIAITCVSCHKAVTKADSLDDLRKPSGLPQVLSCSSSACHTATTGTAQLQLSLYRELGARGKDAKFECALCHTPPQSMAEVPCGHYAAVYAKVKEEATNRVRKAAKPDEAKEEVDKRVAEEIDKRTKGIKGLTPERCVGELK